MIAFTLEQLNGWIGQFIWPFVRILALVATAPLFAESAVPVKVKVGLSFVLAAAIGPTLDPMPPVAPGSYAGLWMVMQQVLTGIALGFTMRIVFASVQTAGEFIGLQMGLSFASFFDPGTGANTAVLSRMLNVIAMLTFLALDGHLLVLAALVRSFDTLPIAQIQLHQNGWGVVVEWGKTIFVSGLLLALPLICALLTINLAMSILNRAAQQLSVFSVGFPVTLIVGVTVLTVVLPHAGPLPGIAVQIRPLGHEPSGRRISRRLIRSGAGACALPQGAPLRTGGPDPCGPGLGRLRQIARLPVMAAPSKPARPNHPSRLAGQAEDADRFAQRSQTVRPAA